MAPSARYKVRSMPKTMFPNRLLAALMATGLMMTTTCAAFAQDRGAPTREDRRAARSGKADAGKAAVRYPDAAREEPVMRTSPKVTSKLKKLFDAHERSAEPAEGVALAEEVINDPNANAYDKAVASRIAGGFLLGSDPDGAIRYMQQAFDFNGLGNNEHFDSLFIVGQLQAQQGQTEAAIATLDRLLEETRSQDPEVLVRKGSYLRELERYPEAITTLKAAIEGSAEPKPEWLQQLMAAYAEAGQGEEATRLAEQIAASTPDDDRSQRNLAATYLQTEQYDKAAAVFEKLRAAGKLTGQDYRNLMVAYVYSEDAQAKVIEVINEGLEKGLLEPSHQTYVALAQAYYFGEPAQVEPAIEAFRKAAPLSSNGETWLNLAKVLLTENRLAEAKQAAQQALDKGIRSPQEAQNILSRSN